MEVGLECRGDLVAARKDGNVAAPRDRKDKGFAATFFAEVVFEPLAQHAGVAAYDVVVVGVVAFRSSEDLYPNLLLGDLVVLTSDLPVADVAEEFGESRGLAEAAAFGDAQDELPARVFEVGVRTGAVGHGARRPVAGRRQRVTGKAGFRDWCGLGSAG